MKTALATAIVALLVIANLAISRHIQPRPVPIGYSCYAPDGWAFNTCKDADGDRRWAI